MQRFFLLLKEVQVKIAMRPLAQLVPYARNARTHSDAQIAQIAASIAEFGFTNPVLADEKGIVAGHGRVLAVRQLFEAGRNVVGADGREVPAGKVPVIDCTGWSDSQRRAYIIADNQLAMTAGWDLKLLSLELGDLADLGFDLGLVGFSEDELAGLLDGEEDEDEGLTDPDAVPDVPTEPVSQRGDVWLLGDHRIICGDCRDPADIRQLVGDRLVNLAFTSPPYAEQRAYDPASGFEPIPPDEYVAWFQPVAQNVADHLAPDGSWFVNIKPHAAELDTALYVFDLVIAHVRQWGWHFATEFCWERPGVPKQVARRFKNAFEPIYQFARQDWKIRPEAVRHESDRVPQGAAESLAQMGAVKKRQNGVTRTMANVQGANAQPGSYLGVGLAYPSNRLPTFSQSNDALGHAAAFPVGLPEFFARAYSDPGDVIFDPFMGSGSSLMAAQRTGRVGLGCEISPAYVDVIVQRWEAFTGLDALLEADRSTFKARRPCRAKRERRNAN
jgi:DNA modification methylase